MQSKNNMSLMPSLTDDINSVVAIERVGTLYLDDNESICVKEFTIDKLPELKIKMENKQKENSIFDCFTCFWTNPQIHNSS